MRKSLLLYLFVFAALLALYQYVSAQKMLESKNDSIEYTEEELVRANQKIDSLTAQNEPYFSLLNNEYAISYFENLGYDAEEIAQRVKDEIISENKASEDNKLVPYEGMEGQMRINKIKILNHKWIIADFTDGSYWGEVFITYSLDENGDLILNSENSFLYPKS